MEEEITKKILEEAPVEKIYDDGLSPAMKEIGKALGNTVKAGRFLLAPVEYVAAYRSRWERYLKNIAEKVEEKNLIKGHPQIVVPVLEGLALSYENTLLCDMFVNLLANSVDKTKQGLVHPAFPKIIQQLSHDEAVILYFLKKKQLYKLRQQSEFDHNKHLFFNKKIIKNEFPIDKLQFPENFFIYMDHLYSLNIAGVWQNGNQEIISSDDGKTQVGVFINSDIKVTSFGKLFINSCVPESYKI
ncbi:MAG: DUF4393 domain-containing protein [Candidatus Moranbacteria bacterium]|nr:DUF4393 domain-containing protein [Candidatus Moranbacteria bacterium]